MPFHSVPKLRVEILSEAGKLSFRSSKATVVSYSADIGSDERPPKIVAAQRFGTGEPLDAKAWHFNEVKGEFAKCLPGIRLFELVFEGNEYSQRLARREKGAEPTINLYRSITGGDKIRFTIAVGDNVITPLDVQLSYELIGPRVEC